MNGSVIATLAFAAVLYGIVIQCGHQTRQRAHGFVVAVRQFKVGSYRTDAVLELASRFQSNVTKSSATCNSDNCSIEFAFEHPLLRLLRFPAPPRLDAGLRIKNHKIGYIALFFVVGGGTTALPVSIFEFDDSQGQLFFHLDVQPRHKDTVPAVFVRFNNLAPQAHQQTIVDLNLSCLNRTF